MSLSTFKPSTNGRPRRVTDAMIAEILRWYAAKRANPPPTNARKAKELGIAKATLECIVRTHGAHYKQPSPEQRHSVMDSARERRSRLRTKGWM